MSLDLDNMARNITIDYLIVMRDEARENIISLKDVKNDTWVKEHLAGYGKVLRAIDTVLEYMSVDPDEAEYILRSNKSLDT